MPSIRDKIIVVTGASSGIGAAAAQALAARGARVCLVARRQAELAQVRDAIVTGGGQAHPYVADLTRENETDALAQTILRDHGRVDVLVNNAGRSIRRSVRRSLDRDHDFRRVMEINYFAALRLTLRLLPGMLERRDGHIVNVSSMGVQLGTPMFSAYIASKSALEGFSRSLAAELADSGVHVSLIRFPLVRTPMTEPTSIYRRLPQMSAADAAGWIVRAIEKRPARVGRAAGTLIEAAHVLFPGTTARWTGRTLRYAARWLQNRAEGEEAPAAPRRSRGKGISGNSSRRNGH